MDKIEFIELTYKQMQVMVKVRRAEVILVKTEV